MSCQSCKADNTAKHPQHGYTKCCDCNGVCEGYNIKNRNPYWPKFCRPRWLPCRELYHTGAHNGHAENKSQNTELSTEQHMPKPHTCHSARSTQQHKQCGCQMTKRPDGRNPAQYTKP